MLRDVRHTVTDGLLGNATATGDGKHVKIGVSPVTSITPIAITGSMDATTIKSRLGLSPLADAVMDSVQFGAGRIYCIPVAASNQGTIGEVSQQGTGAGTLTATGNPTNAFSVAVKITAKGGLNVAAFAVSIDGGVNFGDDVTIPLNGKFDIAGTGVTLTFAGAVGEGSNDNSFLIGDVYTFTTTAPTMTNSDVLDAMTKLKNFSEEVEFVHIVGGSNLALWQAVSELQVELRDVYHKPVFVMMEASRPTDGTNLTDWALQLEADRKKVKNYDFQVVPAWGRLVKLDGTTQDVNLAGVAAGLYGSTAVHVSIGKTQQAAGLGISKTKLLELLPAGMDDSIIELLDVAGFLTFRGYDGLDDYYVYHAKMMCPDGSDYPYAEDSRVRNKVIRETRKEGLQFLNDDIDQTDISGELNARAAFMAAPLDRMIANKEISAAEVSVPEELVEKFKQDEIMRVLIRYVSRGYIREVVVDLGRKQADS